MSTGLHGWRSAPVTEVEGFIIKARWASRCWGYKSIKISRNEVDCGASRHVRTKRPTELNAWNDEVSVLTALFIRSVNMR